VRLFAAGSLSVSHAALLCPTLVNFTTAAVWLISFQVCMAGSLSVSQPLRCCVFTSCKLHNSSGATGALLKEGDSVPLLVTLRVLLLLLALACLFCWLLFVCFAAGNCSGVTGCAPAPGLNFTTAGQCSGRAFKEVTLCLLLVLLLRVLLLLLALACLICWLYALFAAACSESALRCCPIVSVTHNKVSAAVGASKKATLRAFC
jgi:hypothetical protein